MRHPLFQLTCKAILCFIFVSCQEDSASRSNLLGEETSPYLLQHAENPVHWQPWNDQVWEMAKKENKLVLISIGYSSCHWCHVMEEETFENDSVARYMNENFINVKVDREERPDVDQIYMTAVQLMTGSGGWPLNVVTLPDGKPIYGGTYHTPERWMKALREVNGFFQKDSGRASEYAERVAEGVTQVNLFPEPTVGSDLQTASVDAAVANWQTRWDLQWGGNVGIQKFMLPSNLDFLMDYAHVSKDTQVLNHLENTLDRMALGGIFDQLGGGFYRYSTDARWHIPHFEKMLYDNAQLLGLYARAFKVFSNPEYKRVAELTFSFLLRDLKGPGGGYFAAIDADSEGEEGKYYLWKEAELKEVLGPDFELFSEYYSIIPEYAWDNQQFVPYRTIPDDEFLKDNQLSQVSFTQLLEGWQEKLMERRALRPMPRKDDKVITSWNAMLITSLADAYDAFGDEVYLYEARDLFEFILEHCYKSGTIRHSFKEEDTRSEGFLEDYAFLAQAAFRLYQITSKTSYLETAEELLGHIRNRFQEEGSALYRYKEASDLMAPIVKTDDGVMPSPNTVVANLYFQLGHFFYRPQYLDHSLEMIRTLQDRFVQSPENYTGWGRLLLRHQNPFYEVAIVGPDASALRREIAMQFLPDILLVASREESDLPLFELRYDASKTLIFVCQDHSCRLPVAFVSEALGQIRSGELIFP